MAATFVAAEFRVSRSRKHHFLGADISRIRAAANAQVADWWRGRQLGLISFLASAAAHNGLHLDCFLVDQKGLGLRRGDSTACHIQAFEDVLLLHFRHTLTSLGPRILAGAPCLSAS